MLNPKTDPFDIASVRIGDISPDFTSLAKRSSSIAWDIETTGLDWKSDSIRTCQVYVPDKAIEVVRIGSKVPESLKGLLKDENIKKVFHHAMFDLRFMYFHWSIVPSNIACTKIASKILQPQTEDHSLKTLLKKKLSVKINKELATSDWSVKTLKPEQISYAATDVIFLPTLLDQLEIELKKKNLLPLAHACFRHMPTRVVLEVEEYGDVFTY